MHLAYVRLFGFLLEGAHKGDEVKAGVMDITRCKYGVGLFASPGVKMGDIEPVGLSVLYADRRYDIEPQERKVCQIILVQRLAVQMSMEETQTAQGLSPKGKIVEARQEDALCIAHNNVADRSFSGDEHPYLAVEINRHPGKVSGKLSSYKFTMQAPAVDPFESMDLPAFQSREISIKLWDTCLRE
jgi:hypothetical protein